MHLDIRTLLVAVTLATAFCAGARFLLWRMHQTIPGLGRWALAGVSAVITFLLILSYGIAQWSAALSLAQLFIIIGLLLSWDGFRRFLGQPALSPVRLLTMAAVGLLWVVIAQSQALIGAKAVGNAIVVAILSFLIARDLLFSAQHKTAAVRVTGCVYALNAVVFLMRAIVAQHNPDVVEPLNPNGVAAFMLLWLLCSVIAITLGMVLMTAERLQADLDNQANHDPLTGALNRRSCGLLFDKAIAQAQRHAQPLSVLMIDLDEFKEVNDRLGHDYGDKILCRFVAVAQAILREDDVFCRFGGEEFVALLPNTSAAAGLLVANRLRHAFAIDSSAIATPITHQPFSITTSIGIAELEQDECFAGLLRRADAALYRAKDNGRNRCEVAV